MVPRSKKDVRWQIEFYDTVNSYQHSQVDKRRKLDSSPQHYMHCFIRTWSDVCKIVGNTNVFPLHLIYESILTWWSDEHTSRRYWQPRLAAKVPVSRLRRAANCSRITIILEGGVVDHGQEQISIMLECCWTSRRWTLMMEAWWCHVRKSAHGCSSDNCARHWFWWIPN